MRITGIIDPRLLALSRRALPSLQSATAMIADPAPLQGARTPLAQPQTSVAMLLAIASSDPVNRRLRIIADTTKGLGALERLHADLRLGRPGTAHLREMAGWIDNHGEPGEGDLAGLLREVELRVLVELAKAERDS